MICQVFIWVVKLQTYIIFTLWGRKSPFLTRAIFFRWGWGTNYQPSVISFIQAVARWWSSRLVSVGWSTAFGVAPRLARQKTVFITPLCKAIYRSYYSPFITGTFWGPPCGDPFSGYREGCVLGHHAFIKPETTTKSTSFGVKASMFCNCLRLPMATGH